MSDSDFQLSPEQESALDLSVGVALSAGAGSGKTRVLTERYARALEDVGFDLDRVAAVTFTEKAAAELRRRIKKRLLAFGESARGAEARSAAERLGEAWIGTIHALCRRLIASVGPERGRPVPAEVLDADESAEARRRAIAEVLDRIADGRGAPDEDAALKLVLAHGTRTSAAAALEAHASRRAFAEPFAEQARVRTFDDESVLLARATVDDRARHERLRDRAVRRVVARGIDRPSAARFVDASDALRLLGPPGRKNSKPVRFADACVNLAAAVRARDARAAALVVDDVREGFDSKPGSAVSTEVAEAHKRLVVAAKFVLRSLPDSFEEDAKLDDAAVAARGAADRASFELSKAFAALYRSVRTAYEKRLAAADATDFDGLLERADALLRDPATGPKLAARFRHVLVDEFQDTDPLQWGIVRRFFGVDGVERAGACLVGDPKQAIFSFRGGDVATFRSASEETASATTPEGKPVGKAETLRDNYRATPGLVAFVDALQDELFPPIEDAEPCEAWREESVAKRAVETLPDSSVEILEVAEEGGGARRAAEARVVASHVKALIGVREVFDEAGKKLRPAKAGDVAILLRTRRGSREIEEALAAEGVPFRVRGGVGFYSRPEIAFALAALAHLADPEDDAALLALLRSPLIGLPDSILLSAVAREGTGGRSGAPLLRKIETLADAAEADPSILPTADDAPALVAAVARLRRWRRVAGRAPLDELLVRVADDCAYAGVLDAFDPSGRASANVDRLLRVLRARSDGSLGPEALVRAMLEASEDAKLGEQADPADAGDDAVVIATEHGAKGLEWPIVLLPFCEDDTERTPPEGARAPFRVFEGGPFVAAWPASMIEAGSPPAASTRNSNGAPASTAARVERRRRAFESAAESARLFYVAVTRARDHLVFVGGSKGLTVGRSRLAVLAEIASGTDVVFGEGRGGAKVSWTRRSRLDANARSADVDPRFFAAGAQGASPSKTFVPEITVSADAAHLLRACPRRLLLEQGFGARGVEGASDGEGRSSRRPAKSVGAADARMRGVALHAALDAAATEGDPGAQARETARECGFGEGEAEALAVEAKEVASRFVASSLGVRAFAEGARRFTETDVAFEAAPLRFRGRPDLVVKGPEGWIVVDYKSGGGAGDGADFESPAHTAYVAQAEIYAAAVAAATGRPTESYLYFIDSGRVVPVVARGEDAFAVADRWRADAARFLGSEVDPFPKTSDVLVCENCPQLRDRRCDGAAPSEVRGNARQK